MTRAVAIEISSLIWTYGGKPFDDVRGTPGPKGGDAVEGTRRVPLAGQSRFGCSVLSGPSA